MSDISPKIAVVLSSVPHLENIPEEKNLVETDRENMNMDYQDDKIWKKSTT